MISRQPILRQLKCTFMNTSIPCATPSYVNHAVQFYFLTWSLSLSPFLLPSLSLSPPLFEFYSLFLFLFLLLRLSSLIPPAFSFFAHWKNPTLVLLSFINPFDIRSTLFVSGEVSRRSTYLAAYLAFALARARRSLTPHLLILLVREGVE